MISYLTNNDIKKEVDIRLVKHKHGWLPIIASSKRSLCHPCDKKNKYRISPSELLLSFLFSQSSTSAIGGGAILEWSMQTRLIVMAQN